MLPPLLLPLLLASGFSLAVLPLPTYPECGTADRPDLCPNDLDEYWPMISYVPAGSRSSVRAAELEIGSGNGEDKAFRVSTGRFDVLIAVIDSGVDWADDEYQNKIQVNIGELPLPKFSDGTDADDYDLNLDGLVNIQDWSEDPRPWWTVRFSLVYPLLLFGCLPGVRVIQTIKGRTRR